MQVFMRPLVAFSFCLSIGISQAQITIGLDDMPAAGDTIRYSTTTTTADMADTGPDHVWDFSDLVPVAEGADTMVTVSSTPLLYQFFFNNGLLYPDHHASFAMHGTSIGLQGFSIDNVYDYYRSTSTGFRDVGFGATINGLPTSVQRIPVDYIYRFPMAYGNVDSSASAFDISVPALGYYGQSQMRHNEVDGWGTLYLPSDTFAVLRVKSRIERIDTVHIDQLNMGFAIPGPETIEYKWIAQGRKEPVLQVTTVGGVPTAVRFVYTPNTTGIGFVEKTEQMNAWPNPACNVLHVEGMPQGPLLMISADGRLVRTIDMDHTGAKAIDVHALAAGAYLLRSVRDGAVVRVLVAHP
jgi:hypothetical protein